MIKIIIGMFLIAFDIVISPDGRIKLDLLPDFIGYAIIAYGFYRIYKNDNLKNNKKGTKPHSEKSIAEKAGRVNKKAINSKVKNNKEVSSLLEKNAKQGMLSAILIGVMSYVAYLLDMYGVLADTSAIVSVLIGLVSDLAMLLVMFMYIQILSALQGSDSDFQIKRMLLLWKIILLCIICEYISLPIAMAAMTFIIFETVTEIIFMFYIFSADRTYNKKF